MTTTVLRDGRVLHIPGPSAFTDSVAAISAPADADLATYVDQIREHDLIFFAKRLIAGVKRRQHQERWREVNRSRLDLARMCIERALAGEFAPAPAALARPGGLSAASAAHAP